MCDIQAASPSPEEAAKQALRKAEDQRRQRQIAAAKDDAGISSDMLDHACGIFAEGLTTGNYNIRSLLYCVIRDALREHARPMETSGEPKQ